MSSEAAASARRIRARSDAVGVILARHAQSQRNAERRFCGRSEVGLTLQGRAQAAGLAAELRDIEGLELAGVYSSRQRRAIETARAVTEPTRVDDIHEVDQGELEGLTFEEGLARFPEFFSAWRKDPASVRIPGGESLRAASVRVERALRGLVAQHSPGHVILVVGHQMAFASLLAQLAGARASQWQRHALANAQWAMVWGNEDRLWRAPEDASSG